MSGSGSGAGGRGAAGAGGSGPGATGDRKRVLVLDDDAVILRSIQRQLRGRDFDLHLESDPDVAMSLLSDESFDLVLCDIKMKPRNGLDVLRDIKTDHPALPVIMISAFVDDQMIDTARSLGCAEFLFKPVRKRVLNETIDAVFASGG